MDEFEQELKIDFLDEAQELLASTEQAFLRLEADRSDPSLMDEIFRFAHNLKGTSRAVGFGVVAEFTHELENLILKIKQGEVNVTDEVVTILLSANDQIAIMIEELKSNFDASFDNHELIDSMKAISAGSFVSEDKLADIPEASSIEEEEFEDIEWPEEELSAAPVEALDMEALEKMALEQFHQMQKDEALVFKEGDQVIELPEEKEEAKVLPIKTQTPKTPVKEDESIRVSLARVEKLNDFVGELVILQTVLTQRAMLNENDELTLKSIIQLGKISKEIQDISMGLRMIPIKTTLQKMNRIVRDTSKSLGKEVVLNLIGEETEIDKTVLEHLADPLVHIVRNAVDHGLESTEERLAANKSKAGQVDIKAYHEGNSLVIEVRDDGKGINADVIKKKAISKGIISENSNLSDQEIVQLIFHAGFSTKEVVSEVSGRGVGMDVVKTNIEKLSGQVKVDTKVGEGSVFKIVLPLTMAIVDAMVVVSANQRFIIPLSQIHETLKPQEQDLFYVTGMGQCLNLREEVLPHYSVKDLLNLKTDNKKSAISIVVKGKEGTFSVAVDDILHQQQVVIKNLGPEIKDQRGFIGSSILGDGKPAFILDLEELVATRSQKVSRNLNMAA